ncbi:MAG: hypothetical protein IT184_14495 [Acidobacteria bacterium]|nr:hypothetical protein [Acidobacteriota bacterium]
MLWLKGRVASRKKRSLSDALDEIVTAARSGGRGGDQPRSVVGTVDIAADDSTLDRAKDVVRDLFTQSTHRPIVARERAEPLAPSRTSQDRRRGRG